MKASNVPNTAPMIFIKVEKFGTKHTINPLNVTSIKRIRRGRGFNVDCNVLLGDCWLLNPLHFLWSILVTGNNIIG